MPQRAQICVSSIIECGKSLLLMFPIEQCSTLFTTRKSWLVHQTVQLVVTQFDRNICVLQHASHKGSVWAKPATARCGSTCVQMQLSTTCWKVFPPGRDVYTSKHGSCGVHHVATYLSLSSTAGGGGSWSWNLWFRAWTWPYHDLDTTNWLQSHDTHIFANAMPLKDCVNTRISDSCIVIIVCLQLDLQTAFTQMV